MGKQVYIIYYVVAVAPRSLHITPKRSTYQPGERISLLCTAEGNPMPSYRWTNFDNETVSEGADLTIVADANTTTYVFRCTATNHYNGKNHTTTDVVTFSVGIDNTGMQMLQHNFNNETQISVKY